ncbi:peptide chain release factor 2 [bacterium]|nr:peptide chain release factor 2 [bacterium]
MYEELKEIVETNTSRLENLRRHLDIERKETRVGELEKEASGPDFWNNNEQAQTVLRELNGLKETVDAWHGVKKKNDDINELLELAREENDESTFTDISDDLTRIEHDVESLELMRMLGGEHDAKNAIVTIHPGAGGTESQDWAEMLFRMYLRYCQRQHYETAVLDLQAGEEAGIKSATIEVRGSYAFGYLKAEAGVHRLVRISPFDSQSRRHTSFASVFVYPEIDADIEIKINPADLRIDTYRASGAGGQHVNKTSSAVRITHIPSGVVVQCQNERSQFQNKANAMKILSARLYQLEQEEEQKKIDAMEKNKKEIAWGSQIRSYVFHPYNMVKDHRTGLDTSNIQDVMDGDLNDFIRAYLLEFND